MAGMGAKVRLSELVRIDRQVRGLGSPGWSPGQRPDLVCRPVLVDTASPDEKGCLVLAGDRLVAVLVQVAPRPGDGRDGEGPTGWQVEAGFGRCAAAVPPLFGTLGGALAWVRERLGAR